jgi:spore coat protein CotH
MRTSIAFKLSKLLGFPWTPKDRFVELVLNGEYMGNYQLTETVTRGAHRVDIPKNGYLIERDDYYREEPVYFETPRGYGYSFKNPDTDDLTEAQQNYIRDYMTTLETVLAADNFNDPVSGYAKYLDTESFARWFLFQQILANIDANVYLTKNDNGDSKLFMGPVWDFEWSLGVGYDYYGERPRPADYYVYASGAFYYDRLLLDPAFTAELKRQWQQADVTQDILHHIDETEEMLQRSQALNFRRWDILNIRVSHGGIPLGSHEKEVACDRQFFINHIDWLYTAINELN